MTENNMTTRLEKIEIILIATAGCISFVAAPFLPSAPTAGNLLLTMSALLLAQSLIRDIFLLMKIKRTTASTNSKAMRCMCLESTVGITGIVAGIGILGFGIDPPIAMDGWRWAISTLLVLGIGFAIKDLIIQTDPWRIVRDKDHVNIVVSWKK
jgi:hypothetical protein